MPVIKLGCVVVFFVGVGPTVGQCIGRSLGRWDRWVAVQSPPFAAASGTCTTVLLFLVCCAGLEQEKNGTKVGIIIS